MCVAFWVCRSSQYSWGLCPARGVPSQVRRIRRGTQISRRYWEAQNLYDTAVRVRNQGDRELALSCMQEALFIYEQIGVNGEQRALIERAIRELKAQEDGASAQEND